MPSAHEQRKRQRRARHAKNGRDIDRRAGRQRCQRRVEAGEVRCAVEQHRAHESRQHDHFARQPGGAPFRGRAPCALRMAEMEEGGNQSGDEKSQRQRAAERIETAVLRRQQAEGGIGLDGEQGEE
ncbi:MAG: hypothetical protein M5R42_18525 [Rhodocyclaceae bacterium]|nr:hypothetical protein [Rhodocyclaceae bacterium]